jgi:hypothetical protein
MGPRHSVAAAATDDMVLSLLSAHVLEEVPICGSSRIWGLLVNGTTGDSGSTHTRLAHGL